MSHHKHPIHPEPRDSEHHEKHEHEPAEQAAEAGDELNQLRDQLAEAKDRELRAHAEFDNYRKRAHREQEEGRKFSNSALVTDLLPVLDNVQRAIDAAEKNHEAQSIVAGFKMVQQQLEGVLSKYHVTKIEALHKPFDPHVHQAISQQPSAEHPPGTVLIVAQEGYQMHERVLRPAQVIVSTE